MRRLMGYPVTQGVGVADAAAELAGLLLSTGSFEDLLQEVSELTVRTVGGVSSASVTLAEHNRIVTVAHSDEVANQLDGYQYEHESGPCLDALSRGHTVESTDLRHEPRWHSFPAVALEHAVLACLAIPLLVRDQPVGVLNLYARTTDALTGPDRPLAHLLAGQATVAITAALRNFDRLTLSDHLRAALSSRSTIDQAIGIVMARRNCSADDAFGMLRAVSQRRNVKLRVVAGELVASVGDGAGRIAHG
jgi:GAF domain-containing protein